jgi:hypothetical protein
MLFLGGAGSAFAAQPDPAVSALASVAPTPVALSPREAELLRKYDTNHDGRLDENELAAAHLDLMEVQSQTGGVPAQRLYVRLVRLFDRKGEGRLDAAEQAAAVAYLHEHNPVIYGRMLARFDANEDGTLDPAETARLFGTLERLAARSQRATVDPAADGAMRKK